MRPIVMELGSGRGACTLRGKYNPVLDPYIPSNDLGNMVHKRIKTLTLELVADVNSLRMPTQCFRDVQMRRIRRIG